MTANEIDWKTWRTRKRTIVTVIPSLRRRRAAIDGHDVRLQECDRGYWHVRIDGSHYSLYDTEAEAREKAVYFIRNPPPPRPKPLTGDDLDNIDPAYWEWLNRPARKRATA